MSDKARRQVSAADRELFRRSVADALPLRRARRGSAASDSMNSSVESPVPPLSPEESGPGRDSSRESDAAASGKPLRRTVPRPPPARVPVGAVPVRPRRAATPDRHDGNVREFLRPGVGRRERDQLGRLRTVPDYTIDLHGYRLEEAHRVLIGTLGRCVAEGYRFLRVIHGRALHSPRARVTLREQVPIWLRADKRVRAFRESHTRAGGAGALDVLL